MHFFFLSSSTCTIASFYEPKYLASYTLQTAICWLQKNLYLFQFLYFFFFFLHYIEPTFCVC